MIKQNQILKSKGGNYTKIIAVIGDCYAITYDSSSKEKAEAIGIGGYIVTLKYLQDNYEIPEEEWILKEGEVYWFIDDEGIVLSGEWIGDGGRWAKGRRNFLGIFKTKEEAEKRLVEVKKLLKI